MKLRHLLSRQYTEESSPGRSQVLPVLKSPLEEQQRDFQFIDSVPDTDPKSVWDSENGIIQTIPPSGTDNSSIPKGNHQAKQIKLPSSTAKQLPGDEPKFRVHHESSSIELFYDLFFVANLATFTSNHPIDDSDSLASYMGFFTLLWFTWFQTSLYDVRFSIDSLFSRVCKALHFGVMTGFAIVGPVFHSGQEDENSRAFRSLSIILMVSRLILAFQYCTVLWFVRSYKRTVLPVALTVGILSTTGAIFLGITFAFGPNRGSHAQDGCSIGMVVCSVLIIYFLYMLYFDQIDHDRFGTVRQQVWAVLHFPLHVGMLLTVEGSSELILFRLGVELSHWLTAKVQNALEMAADGDQLIQSLNDTLDQVPSRFTKVAPVDYDEFFKELQSVNITNNSANSTLDQALSIIDVTLSNTYAWIFDNLDIEVPDREAKSTVTGGEKLSAIGAVFGIVFVYFFISAGCTMALLSLMHYFGTTHKTRHEIISIGGRFAVGTGLALLATMTVAADMRPFSAFFLSAWILPTVTLCYGFVILLDKLLVWAKDRRLEDDTVDYGS